MIPEKIATFLERANIAFCATRDARLVPHVHRLSGWRVAPDRRVLELLVPEPFTEHLQEALEDNGRVAVTIEEFPSHETYQFKGKAIGRRAAGAPEHQVHEALRERFLRSVRRFMGLPDDTLRAFVISPHLVVAVAVEEIYLQTPGPGAGRRLFPAEP